MSWLEAMWDRLRYARWRPDAQTLARLDVQGHRGAAGLAPENSLAAFEAAVDLGVDTVELDVRLSADGQVVIWHDAYLTPAKSPRQAGAPAALPDPARLPEADPRLWVRHLTAAELGYYGITTLDALFAMVEELATHPLEEATVREAAQRLRFNIEIKRERDVPAGVAAVPRPGAPGCLEEVVVQKIDAWRVDERVGVQSFDTASVRAVGDLAPGLERGVLESEPRLDLDEVASWGVEIWAPHFRHLDAAAVHRAHAAGLRVVTWTVNDRQAMRRLIELGVDGIITDRPDLLLQP